MDTSGTYQSSAKKGSMAAGRWWERRRFLGRRGAHCGAVLDLQIWTVGVAGVGRDLGRRGGAAEGKWLGFLAGGRSGSVLLEWFGLVVARVAKIFRRQWENPAQQFRFMFGALDALDG